MSPDQGPVLVGVGAADVQVWTTRLDAGAVDEEMLSEEERARAARLRRTQDRVRFLAARTVLRRLLAGHAGGRPERIVFATGDAGKPTVAGAPRLHFSHSRCGDLGVFAIASSPVGIDIERIRAFPDRELVAAQFFSERERSHLDTLHGDEADAAFFRCWTRKEAYLKAIGVGIARELAAVDVDPAAPGPVVVAPGRDRPEGVVADVGPGLAVAVAPAPAEPALPTPSRRNECLTDRRSIHDDRRPTPAHSRGLRTS
jgi:4'-phosphopantetheinyl transferase